MSQFLLMSKDRTNARKIEHLRILRSDRETDRDKRYFDAIQLQHRALPEINLSDVDPSIQFIDKTLSFPLIISSMTGGNHRLIKKINKNLAQAAEATNVAMGVGSQRVMFTNPTAITSFQVRPYAPSILLCANLGAIQLNNGFTTDTCRETIEAIAADAIYLHLNPLQEAIQPEGNTNFMGLAEKIGSIITTLNYPVIIKEIGAGISQSDVKLMIEQGVHYIDIAGTGGTSWSRIEHHRRNNQTEPDNLGLTFQDWGIPTPVALKQLQAYRNRVCFIASGGIRNGIDMVKAMILGARLCGMAGPLIEPAMISSAEVIKTVERLKREFTTAMFLLGVNRIEQLIGNHGLIINT